MPQPRDPARTSSAPRQTKKTADPAHRPRPPQGPVAAREWDVAHAAAMRALLTEPPAVLPNQVGDPLYFGTGEQLAASIHRDATRPAQVALCAGLCGVAGMPWPTPGLGRRGDRYGLRIGRDGLGSGACAPHGSCDQTRGPPENG